MRGIRAFLCFACVAAGVLFAALYLRCALEDAEARRTVLSGPGEPSESAEIPPAEGGGEPPAARRSASGDGARSGCGAPHVSDAEATPGPPEASIQETPAEETPAEETPATAEKRKASVAVAEILPEFSRVGEIRIPDTKIAYPLMQCEDASFFLTHGSDGRKNRNGAIFLDPLNAPDLSDPVNYVFGHNMKSGLMFGTLSKFLKGDYLASHSECTITCGETSKTYRIFAAARVKSEVVLRRYNDECVGTEEYGAFLSDVSGLLGAEIPENARLVLLITCSNKKSEKIVVAGILER